MTELMFKPGAIPKQVTLRESAAQILLTRSMMEEIHHIRFLLEAPSTVRAGMMLGDADVAELREIAEMTVEAARSGELVSYVELDREFHGRFLAVLEMPMLVRLIMDYRDRARLIGLRARLGSDEIIEAAREHIALVDAAVARDEAALSRIIANHLEMTRKRSLEGL
jgi:DNA-binding GntR family transcriptional regulator